MSKINIRLATKISFDDWVSIDGCQCGGPIFKYHDTSKNIYIAKCGNTKEILEIDPKSKRKVWIKSKKQPCKFVCCFQGNKTLSFFEKKEEKKTFIMENPHTMLHNQLKSLFTYLFIEQKETFIQEIDYLVKIKLGREPRKNYIFKKSRKISHKEDLHEYHDRIFSEEIIDKTSDYVTINENVIQDIEEIEFSETESENELSEAETDSLSVEESENDSDSELEEDTEDIEPDIEIFDKYEDDEEDVDYY
jgi:hypothetical protein